MMKIKLSDVNNASGGRYEFVFDIPAGEFDFPADDYHIDGTIKVRGTAENTGVGYHFEGRIDCHRCFVCDHCLEEVAEDQVHAFDEIYKEDVSALQDANLFSGDSIDIADLVRDVVIAGQPISNVCKPDCKGLCPQCGVNLNKSECSCDRTVVDVRLAVLKKLLEKN
ncbi:YceD family protein [Pectinatus haikarae]|uniref:YceD family protein n=1 Tax=Pectinatus haikarae TaxID=349096 RepID=UPI0018C65625|nr:DUF177 domain-containing protein [Pectinatus haikarae]